MIKHSPPDFIHSSILCTTIDSHSLATWRECRRRFYYETILGYRSRGASAPLIFGAAMHAAFAAYYRELAKGLESSHDIALHAAIRAALASLPAWPWFADTRRNVWTLIRAVVWHCDDERPRPRQTHIMSSGEPAIEQPFRLDLDAMGADFAYVGTVDRVISLTGRIFPLDYKHTTSSYVSDPSRAVTKFSSGPQAPGYIVGMTTLLPTCSPKIMYDVIEIQVNSMKTFTITFDYPTSYLDEWLDNLNKDLLDMITVADRAGADFLSTSNAFPMAANENTCFFCPFHEICHKTSPNQRERWIKGMFDRMWWDPRGHTNPETETV